MLAFQGLLKKDFHISKNWFFLWIGFLALFLILPFALEVYFHQPLSFLPIAVIMLLGFHVFFLPGMLLSMLRLEGKTQLWLYNPQNSKLLILSKIVISIAYQLIAQLFITCVGLVIYLFFKDLFILDKADLFIELTTLNAGLVLISLYFSLWCLFYWTVYHSLGKYPKMKNWRWLFVVVLFILLSLISSFLESIDVLQDILTKWKIPVIMGASFKYSHAGYTLGLNTMNLPVLTLVLYVAISVGLFVISCLLLDRKVEV